MKIITYLTLFIISFSLFSCEFSLFSNGKISPLDIDVNEVQSIEIYHVFGHRDAYHNLEKDTTVFIEKKDWGTLINDFNTAKSKGLMKTASRSAVLIKLKNKEIITIRPSESVFKIKGDEAYTMAKESRELLNRYYKVPPMKKQEY